MKGGLRITEPTGERWDLALDLIADGADSVVIGDHLQMQRHVGWPGADGCIHIAVLTNDLDAPRELSQARVDEARGQVIRLLEADARLRSIVETHGVVWELAGDDGSATWRIAHIAMDGTIDWEGA